MASEREIVEAKLRELARAAETVAGCALEETLAPGDWADVILAALRESRKVDPIVAAEQAVIETATTLAKMFNGSGLADGERLQVKLREAIDALSALRDEGTDEQHARGRK
jgi:hypothetical protein